MPNEQQGGKQMRFTDPELSLIKNTYKDNTELLKLLRKVFLPEYDPTAPLGQQIDLWMTLDISSKTPEEAMHLILVRNALIGHVEFQLQQLQFLANQDDETPEEALSRLKKNSSK